MPDAYSALLIGSLAAAGLAVAGLLWRRPRLAAATAVIALLLAGCALFWHLQTGHRPGSPQAFGAWSFLIAHPAPVFSAGIGIAVLLVLTVRR